MTSILNNLRRLFKHRQQKRYFVKDGTCVIISCGKGEGEQQVQLIDISHGGMAFIYQGSPSDFDISGILKLSKKKQTVTKIKFDTISDIPVCDNAQSPEQLRRRGVEFKWMGLFAQSDLNDLIAKIKLCEK
jgi:hypothetical protein